MPSIKPKKVNLALQGGGAHGAFTWGILDRLLESGQFTIDGISATSAGSMNAAALVYGYMKGKNEGARQALYDFWREMSDFGKMFAITAKSPLDIYVEPFLKVPFNYCLFTNMINQFSPYEFNPSNFHPIREVLEKVIDIELIKNQDEIKLFICATNVKSGKIRIFKQHELTIESFLASACLPRLFQAVEIDNEFYWDGGYLGNPAIFPLIYETHCQDILLLHTVPIVRDELPTTVAEIDSRLREVSFNSSLMREMRAVAFVSDLLEKGWIIKSREKELKKIRMHGVRADESLKDFPLSSVYSPDWDFLILLRDLGREKASAWMEEHFASVGKKTSIDLSEWL